MSTMNTGRHTVSAFDEELMGVRAKIAEMGGLAEKLLDEALEAIERRDVEMAEQVIASDRRLDKLEQETEELVIRTIALRAPVATDLRLLVAAMKASSTLERVGDLAKSTARRSIDLTRERPMRISGSLVRMGRTVQRQLSDVLNAYSARDAEAALAVWRRDVEVDELYNALFREMVTYMMEDPRTITLGSHCLFMAKNLERIGDHSTHLAEMTWYVVKGEPLTADRPRAPRGYGNEPLVEGDAPAEDPDAQA